MGLDQYAYVKPEKGRATPAFQWRKHAKLQEFMERLFEERTGESPEALNCGELVLEAGDIDALEAAIRGEKLPECAGGFFYGHQFQDESAKAYQAQDLQFCEWARAAITRGETVIYSCWW